LFIAPKSNPTGCDSDFFGEKTEIGKAGDYPGFLLMADGACSYEEKARNA